MRRAGAPCVARAKWGDETSTVLQPRSQVAAFDASRYATASECLNYAFASGMPLVLCRGKP